MFSGPQASSKSRQRLAGMLVACQQLLTLSMNLPGDPAGRVLKDASAVSPKSAYCWCKPRQGQPALAFGLRLAAALFRSRRECLLLFRGTLDLHRIREHRVYSFEFSSCVK